MIICASVLASQGCTFSDGDPFARIHATFASQLERPAERVVDGEWLRLASEYEIKLASVEVEAGEIQLLDIGTSSGEFDPANPPPGYSLCHGGHCHSEDGALVDYEDIVAEISQGLGATVVMLLPVGSYDPLAGEERELDCEPTCDLSLADVGVARIDVVYIAVAGVVRDGRTTSRIEGQQSWSLEMSYAEEGAPIIAADVALPADNDHEPNVDLTVRLPFSVALFDQVPWEQLDIGPEGIALDTDEGIASELTGGLSEQPMTVEVAR